MQLKEGLKEGKALEGKGLEGALGLVRNEVVQILEKLLHGGNGQLSGRSRT